MIVRNSLLGADVAEHVQLLLVFSAHAFFLSGCAVETREFRGTGSVAARCACESPFVTFNGNFFHGSFSYMKRQTASVLAFLAVVLAFSAPSHADSDGDFCTSKGYLAYELREGITPGVVGHVLRVVRFEPKRGIYLATEVTLLDFEVYHLICSEDRIEISGWRNVFTKYVIEIAGLGEVRTLGPHRISGTTMVGRCKGRTRSCDPEYLWPARRPTPT